ncbi:transcription repressor NadR [Halobacillus shinanisalinarum]|uniref:Transcription repressor NadR n=1 Tax=Halobacillus shinanisalinarum TaxID=2932258 RepID=A0ABY4H416_9BACI|nr:transcription repressor NadR [Halobacillus shinanisalinarum]UOQ95201.1 transcription repressor NadR [Halobacillus shinanisalinarum]
MSEPKMKAYERRQQILTLLKEQKEPITGSSIAKEMNVTRQVIVGDVSLIKASGEPIVATSQGYVYLTTIHPESTCERTIVCQHSAEQTEEELTILVDHGVKIEDVVVEHAVYGDLTARLNISSRRDIQRFIEQVDSTNASFLLELTSGIHTHTISADHIEALDEAEKELAERGILLES